MKLKIVDEFWAVGKKAKKVKTVKAPIKVGIIDGIGAGGSYWTIDDVRDDSVKVSYYRRDGKLLKSWSVTKEKGGFYRPRSVDGGHQYTLKLVRLF